MSLWEIIKGLSSVLLELLIKVIIIISVFAVIIGFDFISQCSSETQDHLIESGRYYRYLEKYPRGKYASEAEENVVKSYSRRALYFKKDSCNILVFEKARNNFPKSQLGPKMDSLMELKVDTLYQLVAKEELLGAWALFTREVPERFWRDAESQKERLKTRLSDEVQAWYLATVHDDVDHYKEFLSFHPEGNYATAAEKRLVDLTISDISGSDPGVIQDPMTIVNKQLERTVVRLTNDSDYPLALYFSGPEGRRIIIPSHQEKSVDLARGSYAFAACVEEAKGIRPFNAKLSFLEEEHSMDMDVILKTISSKYNIKERYVLLKRKDGEKTRYSFFYGAQ